MALYSLDDLAPTVADDAWVADNATLLGNVRLAARVGIWFGAVLRGDNELIDIGEASNIQDNCVLHTDVGFPLTVGKGCTIGHSAILHGCTIGDNALIGMGATVLNGAVIGKNAIVGAGALVPEGRIVPDGVLVVGAPCKQVRELPLESAQMLKASAEHYAQNAARFSKGLKRL